MSKSYRLLFPLLALLLVAPLLPGAIADAEDASTWNIELVGYVETPRGASDVCVIGDYAYVSGTKGLSVIDVSNAANPVEVGSCISSTHALSVSTAEGYAYVARGNLGISIIDVTDPTSPTQIGTWNPSDSVYYDACAVGQYVYIAGGDGLVVADVSDPTAAATVGISDSPVYACGIYVSDGYAWVARGLYGLCAYDISDVTNLSKAGHWETENWVENVIVSENYAYVADSYGGLCIIDISAPSSLTQVGAYAFSDTCLDVCIADEYAIVANNTNGVRLLDVSNPQELSELGQYDLPDCVSVASSGGYIYALDLYSGLCILRYTGNDPTPTPTATHTPTLTPTPRPVVGRIDLPYIMGRPEIPGDEYVNNLSVGAFDVYVANDLAYVAAGFSGLEIWDVSHPTEAYRVGLTGIFSPSDGVSHLDAKCVDVANGYAYLACGRDGLTVVDVRTPSNPVVASVWDSPNEVYDVDVVGNYAYVADGTGGLRIVDVSNASSPVEVATTWNEYGLTIKRVYVAEGYAYLACQYYWLVADVTDPTAPTEAGYWQATDSLDVAGYGDFCYFADGNYLWTVLAAHTGYPYRLAACELPGTARGVYSDGEYAYVAVDGPGLVVVDVTNPLNPFIAASYSNFYGAVYDTFAADGYVYFPSDVNGLYILN